MRDYSDLEERATNEILSRAYPDLAARPCSVSVVWLAPGKHVPRLGHLNQLLSVLRVTHVTGHFSAFGSVRIVLRDLFHPSCRA